MKYAASLLLIALPLAQGQAQTPVSPAIPLADNRTAILTLMMSCFEFAVKSKEREGAPSPEQCIDIATMQKDQYYSNRGEKGYDFVTCYLLNLQAYQNNFTQDEMDKFAKCPDRAGVPSGNPYPVPPVIEKSLLGEIADWIRVKLS